MRILLVTLILINVVACQPKNAISEQSNLAEQTDSTTTTDEEINTGASSWAYNKTNGQIMATTPDNKKILLYTDEISGTSDDERKYAIHSSVGPYASVKYEYYFEGGAHPAYGTFYEVMDARSQNLITLLDIFKEEDVFEALLNDGVIQNALYETPSTIDELIEFTDGGCEMLLEENLLESFSFHHIKDDKVAIRIGLTHGCAAARGNLTELGLYLPIPQGEKSWFLAANENKTLAIYLK